jgi:hypothetical protein
MDGEGEAGNGGQADHHVDRIVAATRSIRHPDQTKIVVFILKVVFILNLAFNFPSILKTTPVLFTYM